MEIEKKLKEYAPEDEEKRDEPHFKFATVYQMLSYANIVKAYHVFNIFPRFCAIVLCEQL